MSDRPSSVSLMRGRIQSIDVLRGLVMVIMALDHIRDFFHDQSQLFSPEDLVRAGFGLFMTRWITHFCAPIFIFLAGTSAFLMRRRGMTAPALSRFLITRGLWLVMVEMTFVLFATTFNVTYRYIAWQVIWAIGCCMISLSVLLYLPWRALLAFSLAMIAGHNLFDGVRSEHLGQLGWLWKVFHEGPSLIQLSAQRMILVIYPLIPWIGVMSAGYCFGRLYDLEEGVRRKRLLQLGLGMTIAFVVLRAANVYGDMNPWTLQPTPLMTLASFLRATKYPPSLIYLLMTLGPALLALRLLDGVSVSARNPLLVFGKVPLFYYVVHWFVLHLVALGFAAARYGRFDFLFGLPPSVLPFSVGYPPGYGYPLGFVYLVWIAIILGLYPLCVWFAGVKSRRRAVWLSYL